MAVAWPLLLLGACKEPIVEQLCYQVEGDEPCASADDAAGMLDVPMCRVITSVDGEAVRNNADTGDMGYKPPRYNCCYEVTEAEETCRR